MPISWTLQNGLTDGDGWGALGTVAGHGAYTITPEGIAAFFGESGGTVRLGAHADRFAAMLACELHSEESGK